MICVPRPIASAAAALFSGTGRLLGYAAGPLVVARDQFRFIGQLLSFKPRPDDIYIVTYPRSGTTWLQMILHQLSSDGELRFGHVSEVIPYFERALYLGRDLENLPSPRIFKSHMRYRLLYQENAKYIYVTRDGRDVALSLFQFQATQLHFEGSFTEFFQDFVRGSVRHGSWFKHVSEWKKHAGHPNILFLDYEDLVADLEGSIRKVAAFCGYGIDAALLPGILERCSFPFMKCFEGKFDCIAEMAAEKGLNRKPFIRQGKAGTWREHLDADQLQAFEDAVRTASLS